MSFQSKTIGFLAVLACLPAANAATARPSVRTTAAARMPTMTTYISQSGTTVTGTTTSSTLLANTECIDAYTSCMKGADACGSNFEECTTNVLFHGKMPQCLSTLAQCSTAGVQSLFGTGNVSALSTIKTKNTYGEVTEYTYPTEGSVLGQLIIGAAISNKYDTSTCVKRYTSCLKKDSVCGVDFELCTTDSEFRKQKVYCDSTLARCQSEGLIELFGSTNTSTAPSATSRIGEAISEGAALAAVNAVSTCYKVVDQCFLNACAENPYRCYENSKLSLVNIVDAIKKGTSIVAAVDSNASDLGVIAKNNISGYIKNSCLDTIGGNKYCYATFLGNGQMPTSSQLRDEDNQEEIFDEAYNARMNAAMKSKITDLINEFDTKTKDKCSQTIQSCVMRTCGGGSGAACYSEVFSGGDLSVNKSALYGEIQTGCAAVVNTDSNCQYAATNPNSTGTYTYTYNKGDAFTTLFPQYEEGGKDPIGVVAALNASLQNSYNDAAIAQMRKRCQNVATSCVKSMCGADYQNCYRNRTDVYSNLTDTGSASFDKSMNKVGGVLDYTVVLGLCLDTVKNANVCEEHLKIEQRRIAGKNRDTSASWGANSDGTNTVRSNWIDAGGATQVDSQTVNATDEYGNALCTSKNGYGEQACDTVDADGNVYDQPVTMSYTAYTQSQAASTLFKDLIYDLEKEAQAKYNAKLTKQQNMCMSSNAGGVMGNKDTGSTFMWVKLKSQKVPASYPTMGLQPNQFVASNDIYNSFCRVRISLLSDDKRIQDVIGKGTSWSTAYFAAGDSFTCGSWIPGSALEELANAVAKDARDDASKGNGRTKAWATVAGVVGLGTIGGIATNKMQDGAFLGGLLGTSGNNNTKDIETQLGTCSGAANAYVNAKTVSDKATYLTRAQRAVNNLRGMDEKKFNTASLSSITIKGGVKCSSDDAYVCLNDLLMEAGEKHREYADLADMKLEQVTGTEQATSGSFVYDAGKTQVLQDSKFQAEVLRRNSNWEYVNKVENITCRFRCDVWNGTNGSYSGNRNVCKGHYKNEATEKNGKYELWVTVPAGDPENTCMTGGTDVDNLSILYTVYYTDKAAVAANEALKKKIEGYNKKDTALKDANEAMARLQHACTVISPDSDAAKKEAKKRAVTNAIGAGVSAVAGGVLAYQAVKSIQDAKLDKVEKEAYDEWMNAVGDHIRCYVGGDEVGMYGDIISTSME